MSELKKDKKGKKVIKALKIIIFEILLIGVTSPFVAFYGPFERIKYVLVGSAMQSSSHQYIAKLFLSDKAIESILYERKASVSTKNTDTSKFKPSGKVEFQALNSNKHFNGYVILVHDPKRVKVGLSSDFNLNSMAVDSMAERYGAIAAVNGSGYNLMGDKKISGYAISNGEIKQKNVKNDDEKINAMLITRKGKLLVGDYSINDTKKLDVSEALCFGPALLVDGKAVPIKDVGILGIAPRTAVGQRADGTIMMVTVEGRSAMSFGASIKDLQDILLQYGAVNAYNLDGGGSTHAYFSGENGLQQNFIFRAVPTILYVK